MENHREKTTNNEMEAAFFSGAELWPTWRVRGRTGRFSLCLGQMFKIVKFGGVQRCRACGLQFNVLLVLSTY